MLALFIVTFVIGYVLNWTKKIALQYLESRKILLQQHYKAGQKVLLVTAHPDDECMFFVPAVRSLVRAGVRVQLLCLSSGNYEGQGDLRKLELRQSVAKLGLDPMVDCMIIESEGLADHPKKRWEANEVAQAIEDAIANDTEGLAALMTFDLEGVSGHLNHCDLSTGVRLFAARTKLGAFDLLELESVPLVAKYIGSMGIIYEAVRVWLGEFLGSRPGGRLFALITAPDTVLTPWNAMRAHASQMLWYRYLYLGFSRYMYINTLYIRRPK